MQGKINFLTLNFYEISLFIRANYFEIDRIFLLLKKFYFCVIIFAVKFLNISETYSSTGI